MQHRPMRKQPVGDLSAHQDTNLYVSVISLDPIKFILELPYRDFQKLHVDVGTKNQRAGDIGLRVPDPLRSQYVGQIRSVIAKGA